MKIPQYINRDFVALNATIQNFGVDKLVLHTNSFEVDNITNWNLKPNTKRAGEQQTEPTQLTNISGQPLYGEKLFINKPQYTAEINKYGMRVALNPSKIFHPSDLTTEPDKIADSLSLISSDIKETLNTNVDLFAANISRLDIAAQAEMNNPVPYYNSIIQSSKHLKRAPKTEYPNGFLMGNGQRKVCTYDKGLKLQIDNGIKTDRPTNFFRVEPRFLTSESVRSHTPFKAVNDLLNANIEGYKWAYSKTLNSLMQINQTPVQFIELNALTDLISTAIKTSRQWLHFLLIVLKDGSLSLPTVVQFEQALTPLVHNNIIERSTAYRNVKKYQELIHQTSMLRSAYQINAEKNYIEQHQEFIDKFINPYKAA